MSSTDHEDDPSFVALPARVRHLIDDAFGSIASRLRSDAHAGGLIVEEPEASPSQSAAYEAGGFIIEDLPSVSTSAQTHIPLPEIPRALHLLDLEPDDDLMGVFKNAATGWGAQNANDGVSKKDWRAICAALLEGEHTGTGSDGEHLTEDVEMDSGLGSDEYQAGEQSESEQDSNDEYEESVTRTRPEKAQSVPQRTPGKRELTQSEKQRCRQDFGRFFPDVPDSELDRQRIMIKDIARVAELLKENLKTEEILDMLDAFSTSPDKSMNLADFERMMVLTKLVGRT